MFSKHKESRRVRKPWRGTTVEPDQEDTMMTMGY